MFGWVALCGGLMVLVALVLSPVAGATRTTQTAGPSVSLQNRFPAASTPEAGPAVISLTPTSGPVGTLISVQSTGWPASTQLLLKYGQDPTCVTAQEFSPDPKPTT